MTTIDLHGVKHESVSRLLDEFIWDNMKAKNSYASVITGNSDEMKRLVSEAVAEYGFVAEQSLINTGTLTINLF
jgi:DNA-nicking Smr family endonuclease